MKKLVVFDWNGTLLNDTPEWWECVKEVFKKAGFKKQNIPDISIFLEAINQYNGIIAAYQCFGVKMGAEEIMKAYTEAYDRIMSDIAVYPSSEKTLKTLKDNGVVCVMVTWSISCLFWPIFNKTNLGDYFDHMFLKVGNKALAISDIREKERVKPGNCYYVGDMPIDIIFAKKAKVKSVIHLNGLTPISLIEKQKPDFIISDLEELPAIVLK